MSGADHIVIVFASSYQVVMSSSFPSPLYCRSESGSSSSEDAGEEPALEYVDTDAEPFKSGDVSVYEYPHSAHAAAPASDDASMLLSSPGLYGLARISRGRSEQ